MRFKKIKTMKDIMTVYYSEAKSAPLTGKKVAWITSGGPVEPLIAMDIIPVYPENHDLTKCGISNGISITISTSPLTSPFS